MLAHAMRKILSIRKLRKFELHETIFSFPVRRPMAHHSMSASNKDKLTQRTFRIMIRHTCAFLDEESKKSSAKENYIYEYKYVYITYITLHTYHITCYMQISLQKILLQFYVRTVEISGNTRVPDRVVY